MINIKRVSALALVAVAFPGAAWLLAEDRMRAGLWEVSSLSGGKSEGSLGNTCYTAEMVKLGNLPANTIREGVAEHTAKTGCTLKDFKIEGNKMSMTTQCRARTSVIVSTYTGDTFDTVATMTEAGATTVMHMKGRRIGDCK